MVTFSSFFLFLFGKMCYVNDKEVKKTIHCAVAVINVYVPTLMEYSLDFGEEVENIASSWTWPSDCHYFEILSDNTGKSSEE